MKKALPIGVSDFAKIRERDLYYVDKTAMIADWLQFSAEVTLITRPRRFGKTLNMTMLREFFDMTHSSAALFKGLAISRSAYAAEMNQWPVIFLSFKDCKNEWAQSRRCLMRQLQEAYLDFYLRKPKLDPFSQARLERLLELLTREDGQDMNAFSDSIYFLSKLIYQQYGKKVIILIDEYDTPMLSAYEHGYYEDVRAFFTSLYGSALKDNPYLERAMLSGIHRIAKENIFSGLNNPEVCTVLSEKYQQHFGLTGAETAELLAEYELALDEAVQRMYDGYRFGTEEIYNPWSIINYANTQRLSPYWVNTASNELLVQAMLSADADVQEDLETLLSTGWARVPVDLQTSFFEIEQPATLWGLFVGSGYLTIKEFSELDELQTVCIPNQEVMSSFRKVIERYGGFKPSSLAKLFDALLYQDMERFRRSYEQIVLTCTSFHDGAVENAYHMLFLGMCVYLNGDYEVRSNVESGHGRADILLAAKRPGKPNFVIEFKQGEDIERLAQAALTQIHQQRYYAALRGETVLIGIAHNLKQCQIASETIVL